MTAEEIIEQADALKPNAFPASAKLRWLNALEGRIAAEVMLMPQSQLPELQLRLTDTPMVDPPYDDIYLFWLEARIDEANGEYDKYANTSALFNAAWDGFVCWFCQTYDPAQGVESR